MAVKVWIADPALMQAPQRQARWRARLSPEEQARADRFFRAADRETFMTAHALLRAALAHETGGEATSLDFLTEPQGRPFLAASQQPAPPVEFSISHTAGCVAVALSRNGPVGVDVEAANRLQRDPAQFAADWYHAEEASAVSEAGSGAGRLAISLWCLKEAYGKARGLGLRLSSRDSHFVLDSGRARALVLPGEDAPAAWHFAVHAISGRHVLALATPFDPGAVTPVDGADLLDA